MLRSLVAEGLELCDLPLSNLQPRPVVPTSPLLLPVTQYLGKFPSDALLVAAKEMSRDLKRQPRFSSRVLPTRGGVEELGSRTGKEKYSPLEVIWKQTVVLCPNQPCIYLQILHITQKERAG